MTNEPGMLPPGVVEEDEITVNEILADWEGEEMVPMEIAGLRLSQRGGGKSHSDDEGDAMLPPGVV